MRFDKRLNNGALRAMQAIVCVALLALCPLLIFSQSDVKSDAEILKEINDLYSERNYSKAIEKANLAAKHFIIKENWERLIQCQFVLFNIEHLDVHQESLLPELEYIHSYIPDSMESNKAKSAYNIAYFEDNRGNIVKALKYLKTCIGSFTKLEDWENLSSTLLDLGIIYTKKGDYSRAAKYYNASAELSIKINDSYGYSYNIFDLAINAYYKGNYQECDSLYKQFQSLEPQNSAETYFNLSELKYAQEELDSAKIYLNEALKWKKDYDIPSIYYDILYAYILSDEGDFEGALTYLKKDDNEIDSIENIRDRGKVNWDYAEIYFRNKDFDQALNYYNRSLQSFTNGKINIDSIGKLKQNDYLFHEIWVGEPLIGMSNVFAEKYRGSKDEKYKIKSKECLDLALMSLDYKRNSFEDIESSFFLNKGSKRHYEKAINIYLDWYEESGLESEIDQAFQLAQRHNAFILRQQINNRTKLDRYRVDELLKEEYLDLKLQALESSLIVGKKYSKTGFNKLRKIESRLDSIEKKLAIEYPRYAASKDDFSVASVEEIQNVLKKDEAVIKYFEGEKEFYSFVISKNEIGYFVHQKLEDIQSDIDQIRSILSDYNYSRSKLDSIENHFLDVSFRLGKSIIAEEIAFLPDDVQKLTIVPSGALTKIPLETLVIKKKNSWKNPTQYLIYDYAISYNYFCKALTVPKINKELENVLSYGLVYDDYTLNASKKISNDSLSIQILEKFRSEEMGHLYFAADEANEVAEMFDGLSFLNEKATKQNFLSNVADYDIIHLSAHSFVDYQYPSNSAIIFSKKDSLTDNLLQIKDVDRLSLDGQLFTLSACNTFFGKKNEGEGLSSIAMSFIQSGAGSVVGSFWSVPDEISKSFMIRFYSKLKEGMTKDEALRATKIDFMTDDNLSSPLYRSPVYWSAWVIYGDTQRIYETEKGLIYFGIGLLFLTILLLIKYRIAISL